LFLALAALVGIVLLGAAGYYFYTKWSENEAAMTELDAAKAELDGLQKKKLSADLVKAAREQTEEAKRVLEQFSKVVPPAAPVFKVDERTFKSIFDKSLAQLQTSATNNGVNLVSPDYAFSFSTLTNKLNFPTNCIDGWLSELNDIKAICGVVYNARVNTLESIRRPGVAEDETGPNNDLLATGSAVTNDTIVRVPYELTVRLYSREAAQLINSLLLSTNNCYLIRNLDISPSLGDLPTSASSTYTQRRTETRRTTTWTSTSGQTVAEANPTKPTTIVAEGLVRVVILLEVVKTKSN